MVTNRYVDTASIIQVIGNIYNNPNLLDSEKYKFNEEDVPLEFHKILFGSIYNLHTLGAKEININKNRSAHLERFFFRKAQMELNRTHQPKR